MLNLHNVAFVRSAVKTGDFPNDALPQIAFAGKSNVGKSSTINRLLNRKNFARVGNEPGKTVHKGACPLGTADGQIFCQ